MEIQRTHERSCLLDCFAFVLGFPPTEAMYFLGDRGEENGFHTQQVIDLASMLGFSVTHIERYPSSINRATDSVELIEFPRSSEERFAIYLGSSTGVILGSNAKGERHTVAWKNQTIHDSATGRKSDLLVRDSSDCLVGIKDLDWFTPHGFLRVAAIA